MESQALEWKKELEKLFLNPHLTLVVKTESKSVEVNLDAEKATSLLELANEYRELQEIWERIQELEEDVKKLDGCTGEDWEKITIGFATARELVRQRMYAIEAELEKELIKPLVTALLEVDGGGRSQCG